jgi:hypothetical protein
VSTNCGDMGLRVEGGKKAGKGDYIIAIDYGLSSRGHRSTNEMDCEARTSLEDKNMRASRNFNHNFNKEIHGRWRSIARRKRVGIKPLLSVPSIMHFHKETSLGPYEEGANHRRS